MPEPGLEPRGMGEKLAASLMPRCHASTVRYNNAAGSSLQNSFDAYYTIAFLYRHCDVFFVLLSRACEFVRKVLA